MEWTDKETERLRVLYLEERKNQSQISEILGRSVHNIKKECNRHGWIPPVRNEWATSDEEKLKDLWLNHRLSGSQIGDLLGRTRNAIMGKLHRMGLHSPAENKYNSHSRIKVYDGKVVKPKKQNYWDKYRLFHLKKLVEESKTSIEIAEIFNWKVSAAAIRQAANKYLGGMKTPRGGARVRRSRPDKEHPPVMRGITIADLGSGDCRYPTWGPEEKSGAYCGNAVKDGNPYCEHHMGVAYLPGTATMKRRWTEKINTAVKKYG
jgi:GcrA cell cycle regulator